MLVMVIMVRNALDNELGDGVIYKNKFSLIGPSKRLKG